jgi:hypothetical protein
MRAPQLNILLPPLHTNNHTRSSSSPIALRQLPCDAIALCIILVYDLCVFICYTQLYISTRVYFAWLIFLCAELGARHLDPWLGKLTCERALTGSTCLPRTAICFLLSGSCLSSKAVYGNRYIRTSIKYTSASCLCVLYIPAIPPTDSSSMHKYPNRRTMKSIPGLADLRSRGLLIHVTVMAETRLQGTSLLTLLLTRFMSRTPIMNHRKPAYTSCSGRPPFLQED